MGAALALACVVIAIADGDTLTARCLVEGEQQTLTVRLSQIDAPELRQAWGVQSRRALSALCLNVAASVREETRDKYRRMVARVSCNGVDASAEQVRAGYAWVFDKYATDSSLYRLQLEASNERRGLWSDNSPVAPWEWRKFKRND